jgi:hypothetical protein
MALCRLREGIARKNNGKSKENQKAVVEFIPVHFILPLDYLFEKEVIPDEAAPNSFLA